MPEKRNMTDELIECLHCHNRSQMEIVASGKKVDDISGGMGVFYTREWQVRLCLNCQEVNLIQIEDCDEWIDFDGEDYFYSGSQINTLYPPTTDNEPTITSQYRESSKNVSEYNGGIFISYSHKDSQFVEKLAEELQRNLQIWFDKAHIKPGDYWRKRIQIGLEKSSILLLIMTTNALESEYVSKEYSYFLDNEKTIIPLVIGSRDTSKIPHDLSGLHCVFCSEEMTEQEFEKLLELLKSFSKEDK